MTARTLVNGRIPQKWDLPWLRQALAHDERLTRAPDPQDAAYFRAEAETKARAIKEIEADAVS